jgi:hypothetical protein
MMVPCMRPWRRLFSALYEGKETSAGPRAAPPAMLLQGSSTSPPATLAHSYTPTCTVGPSPCIYKRRCPGPTHNTRKGRRGRTHSNIELHSATLDFSRDLGPVPSLTKLVAPTASTPAQDNISLIPPLVFHLASTHLGRDTRHKIH